MPFRPNLPGPGPLLTFQEKAAATTFIGDAGFINNAAVLYAPTQVVQIPTSAFIGPTGTTYAPTQINQKLTAPAIGPTGTTYAPTKIIGIVKPSAIGPTGTLYAPTQINVTEKPGLIGPTGTLYAPSKIIGTVKPGAIGPSGTLYAPTQIKVTEKPGVIGPTGTLYAPVAQKLTWLNNAEGGSNGTTVTAGNSGGASGDAFQAVNIGAGSALTFDNAHAAHGTLAYNIDQGNNVLDYLEWTTTVGTRTDLYFRFYIYVAANPLATLSILRFSTGATNGALVRMTTTRKLQVLDATNTSILTGFTNAAPLNTWTRVEGHIVFSASVGSAELRMYSSGLDAPLDAPTETQSASGLNTSASVTTYRTGSAVAANADLAAYWLDDIGIQQGAWLGPISPTVYPPILASTATLYAPREVLTVKPGFIGPTGTLYAPTQVKTTVKPGLIGPTDQTFAPTRVYTAKVFAPLLSNPAQTLTPTKIVATVKPGFIGPTGTLYAPSKIVATVKPGLIGPRGTLYAPSEILKVATGLLDNHAILYSPARVTTSKVFAPSIGPSGTLYEPAEKLTVAAPIIGPTGTLYAPERAGVTRVFAPLLNSAATLYAPSELIKVATGLLDNNAVLYAPASVSFRLYVPLVGPSGTLYVPNFGGFAGPPLLDNPATLHAPSVSTTRVYAPLLNNQVTLHAPTISTSVTIAPGIIGPDTQVISPSVRMTIRPGLIGPIGMVITPTRQRDDTGSTEIVIVARGVGVRSPEVFIPDPADVYFRRDALEWRRPIIRVGTCEFVILPIGSEEIIGDGDDEELLLLL